MWGTEMCKNSVTKVIDSATTLTAGGTVQQTSDAFDFGTTRKFLAAKVIVPFKATLSGGKIVDVQVTVQDSANNSTYATFKAQSPKGTTIGQGHVETTGYGVVEVNVDLRNTRRYLKVVVDATFTATGTDTITENPILLVLYRPMELPATANTSFTTQA